MRLAGVVLSGRGKDHTVDQGVKQLDVHKDSIMDKRIPIRKLEGGRQDLANPMDCYTNNCDRVLAALERWYVQLGNREWTTKKLKEQLCTACDLSSATVERILKQMQMKDGDLIKVRHGTYKLKNAPA